MAFRIASQEEFVKLGIRAICRQPQLRVRVAPQISQRHFWCYAVPCYCRFSHLAQQAEGDALDPIHGAPIRANTGMQRLHEVEKAARVPSAIS